MMKNVMITIGLSLLMVFTIGCAEEKKKVPKNQGFIDPSIPYVPPGNGPGAGPGSNWDYGGTADLIVTSSALNDYLGWTTNDPTDVRVNINLVDKGESNDAASLDGRVYGGVVTIGFQDSGFLYEDYFTSDVFSPWSRIRTDEENAKYNIAFAEPGSGDTVWHGFFQDYYGGIVVVIDDVIDLGDGQPVGEVSGSIWFKPFRLERSPVPPTSCWFVSRGPYDCRAWPSGSGVNTDAAVYPDNGYEKLGDFYGLKLEDAFNGEAAF